jgi:endonuclease/exonuclease/phosphatase family metal-dependent hydrolase
MRRLPDGAPTSEGTWLLAAGTVVLPVFALVAVALSSPVPAEAGAPLRFMTYNLHSAFNTDGAMGVEEIARVIEDSGAVVVGLQEIDRGRLLNANTDLFSLLKQRLGFEYAVFFGTTDPTWGNAIFSRYPITGTESEYLPLAGTPLRRGYLGANILLPGDRPILFISTHLQHVKDPDVAEVDPEGDLYPVHHEQIGKILQLWDGSSPAVLVGDFNAEPGWQQIEELISAGWADSWAENGIGDGFTWASSDPSTRIDYIFHTPDLSVLDVGVIPSLASDHIGIVAEFSP